MKVHYFEMWNHSTSTIEVPEKYKNPFNLPLEDEFGNPRRLPPTSLEILQEVLHGEKYKAEFIAVEEYMKKIKNNVSNPEVPSCLAPDTRATRKLADKIVEERKNNPNKEENWTLPLPILNMGYPKAGSTTLKDFFNCVGIKANHGQEGEAMFQRIKVGRNIFKSPKKRPQAFCQLDQNARKGYYPQISLLDEVHATHPNTTFVMNFRPIPDWIRSMERWRAMVRRFSYFFVPGLVLTPEQLEGAQAYWEARSRNGTRFQLPRISNVQIAKWWCGHVLHLREYVNEYPSHALIELDLYSTESTSDVMYDLFQADATNGAAEGMRCWGKSNANDGTRFKKKKKKKLAKPENLTLHNETAID
eukprot:CAMPEP_0116150976 /NCGR_PEP_ID=MMETSP0329-20121206/19846_1 /TAXON_ID=697910 /ORGANISM="Pseudo-nitzschia arenysensis, Strain B593" /LENGTH=359 /DNA_ID=CAMNT_0003647549 /DNA_START=294 /DNA_END=1373 /DNA_ORIENTATION=+